MRIPTLMYDVKMSTVTSDTADIYIYSEITGDFETFFGDIKKSDTSANSFRQKLDELGNVANINLYINSNGGSCKEGNAIYSMLKRHSANTTAYIDGFACSEASVIAMACDKIVMQDNAMMMIHNPSMFCYGNSKEFRKQADVLDVMSEAFRQAYLGRFNGTEKELCKMLDDDTWLTAKQCVEYGFADEIAGFTPPAPPKAAEPEPQEPQQKATEPVDPVSNTVDFLKSLVKIQI